MAFDLAGLGSIISAAGGIADSFFGDDDSNEAKELSKEQLKFMMRMATAGQEDALGNRVYYDSATNSWKVDLNSTSRASQVASDQEELNRLTTDLPRERYERGQAALGRSEDASIADVLRRRIIDKSPMTAERLEGDLYNAKARGIRESADTLGSKYATQGLRTGVNPSRELETLSRTLSRELANASSDARLEALTGADDINIKRGNSAIDQYGAMEGRARNISNVPFNPASLSSSLQALAAGRQGALEPTAYAGDAAVSSLFKQPTNQFAKIGTSIEGLLAGFSALSNKKPTDPTVGNQTYTG